MFVLDCLAVIRVRARDIHTAHFEQKLALLHFVAQPGVDFDHSSRCQRWYRHLARYVGIHNARDIQLGSGVMFAGGRQWELIGVIYLEIVGVEIGLDVDGCWTGAGRQFVLSFHLLTAIDKKEAE